MMVDETVQGVISAGMGCKVPEKVHGELGPREEEEGGRLKAAGTALGQAEAAEVGLRKESRTNPCS